jgi:hypothetical protein
VRAAASVVRRQQARRRQWHRPNWWLYSGAYVLTTLVILRTSALVIVLAYRQSIPIQRAPKCSLTGAASKGGAPTLSK